MTQAREQGKDVLLAMPFWRADGRRMLALKWLAPSGAWASLGTVGRIQDLNLHSPQCHALSRELHRAAPASRLDFSENFGNEALPSATDHRPSEQPSAAMPAGQSADGNAMFMYQRIVARQGGDLTLGISPAGYVFMPPAHDRTNWVEFDVTGLRTLTLTPRINPLNAWCKARTDTGVVGVRVSLDGALVQPRFIVDRNHVRPVVLDIGKSRRLRVEVDEGNGTPYCDWFALGFPSVGLQSPVSSAAATVPSRG